MRLAVRGGSQPHFFESTLLNSQNLLDVRIKA